MLRPALLLAALTLAGCSASSYVVDRTDPAAVARLDGDVRGRNAEIALVSGDRYAGAVTFVRVDSTSWEAGEELFVVPTPAVFTLAVDTRGRALRRGALIGTGVGLALAAAVVALAPDPEPVDEIGDVAANVLVGANVAFLAISLPVSGAMYGLLSGALSDSRTTYMLEDPYEDAGDAPLPETDDADAETIPAAGDAP